VLTYDTLGELKIAVENRLGYKLSDDEWGKVKPYWSDPYGNGDVVEIAKTAKLKFRRPAKTRRSKGRRSKNKEVIENLQRYYWYADWLFRPMGPLPDYRDHRAKDLGYLATDFRALLGLSSPVRLDKLKEVLMELGAKDNPPGLKISYPQQPQDGDYISVGFLYYDWRRNKLLHNVHTLANHLANVLNWHPAEVTAFLFCNKQPLSRDIARVYKQGREITIKVGPNVQPDAVAKLYSKARNEVIKEIRGIKGKTARPRRLSLRVRTLLDFSLENPALKGEELRRVWNEKYPHWEYGSVHSLTVVISRAAKKELSRMNLGYQLIDKNAK